MTATQTAIQCNADLGHPCDADDGDPCPSCKAEEAYWRRKWERYGRREYESMLTYEQDVRDAGRAHLVG